ncbi:MAG: nitroreductase family protein [Planctomycetota bacterium]
MDVFEAIETRRAVKHYDPEFVMPEADLERLTELAQLSPSSFNIQNWRFVLVRDPELKKAIRAAAWDQAQVEEAAVTIALCCDIKSWSKDPARYWAKAPKAAADVLVPMIPTFYDGNDQLQRDEAIRSGGIAAQTIMLAARGLGYDSCPMIGFDPVKVAELINLPEHHVITMLITVGKALKPAHPRGGLIPKDEAVIHDRFPA